jgi:phosphoglycerate dehydrogenase-like enzyme
MKLRCAILDDYQNVALKLANWASLSERVEVTSYATHFETEDALVQAIHDKEIIVIMRERTPFGKSLFERLPNLKLLITSGSRNAAIDLDAAAKFGVTVCGTASTKEPPMELTWGLILSVARHIPQENHTFKSSGAWQSTIGTGLRGKRLGLLGLGKVGSLMVPVAKAFGMEVVAWSQNLTKDKTDALGISLATSKHELLEKSDFVSIHLILSDRTHHLLQAHDLKRMRPSSYLINTSRASIVNPIALVEALQNGWIIMDPENCTSE